MNGTVNEEIMAFFLSDLGFADLRPQFDKKSLLATVEIFRKGRLTNVANRIPGFKTWDRYKSNYIIDRVYGIDYIIEVDPTGERVAFDFTLDAEKVRKGA
jgi:hypothetical protein